MRSIDDIVGNNLRATYEKKIRKAHQKIQSHNAFVQEVEEMGVIVTGKAQTLTRLPEELENAVWQKHGDHDAFLWELNRLWAEIPKYYLEWSFSEKGKIFLTLDSLDRKTSAHL